jgi:hypothetical protein
MSKLIFVPKPFPEESPSSILRRLSDRHGHNSRTDLSYLYGSPYFGGSIAYRNHPLVQNLAKLIPFPDEVEPFLNGFYPPLSNLTNRPSVNIYGLEVQFKMMRIKTPAFCSECWKNKCEYFIKDLALAVYCPYHFRKYLSRCPTCGHSLAWQDLLSHGCRCPELPESPPCSPAEATIEQRLLHFFRTRDSDSFERFKRYLHLLGYERKDRCDCPATRNTVFLALALVDGDPRALLRQLNQLQRLYLEVPGRILCAKLAAIPTPEARSAVRVFLKTKYSVTKTQAEEVLPITTFSLSRVQVTAWQQIRSQERNMLRQRFVTALSYSQQQAAAIAQELLKSRLRNEFSRKKPYRGQTVHDLRRILRLPTSAITAVISEGLLTPVTRVRSQLFFNLSDVKDFSERYVSIEQLSWQTKIPSKMIRKAMKRFESLDEGFINHVLKVRVISIEKKDAVIAWLNRSEIRPRAKNLPHNMLPHLTDAQSGVWLSAAEAATELAIPVCVLKGLIRVGLLKCYVRLKGGTGYALNQKDVSEFKERYIGVRDAAALLDCALNNTTRTLKALDILPKTGPEIDKCSSHFFLRKAVVSRTREAGAISTGYYIGCTIEHAIRTLKLSRPTITTLVERGALLKTNKIKLTSAYLNTASIDCFYDNYITTSMIAQQLKIPIHCCVQLLASLNIFPIAGTQQKTPKRYVYELDQVSRALPKSKPSAAGEFQAKSSHLVNIANLRSYYKISKQTFTKMFISSGFAHPLGVPTNLYLTKSDATRITKILDKYFTYSQIGKEFGHPSMGANLIKTGILTADHPLRPYTDYPMLKRSLLENYAASRSSSKTPLAP